MPENDSPETDDVGAPWTGPTPVPETPPPPPEVFTTTEPDDGHLERGPTAIPEVPPPDDTETR
jgi:hypothetical protein